MNNNKQLQTPSEKNLIASDNPVRMSRRRFLAASGMTAVGMGLLSMGGLLGSTAAWAERKLGSHASKTLLRMARDVFPHDDLPDLYYAKVMTPMAESATSDSQLKTLLLDGVAALDVNAKQLYGRRYIEVEREDERVEVLKLIEATPFFAKVRGTLMIGLYDNKELWPTFGYEGSSWEKGGYINRGFNDLDWLVAKG